MSLLGPSSAPLCPTIASRFILPTATRSSIPATTAMTTACCLRGAPYCIRTATAKS